MKIILERSRIYIPKPIEGEIEIVFRFPKNFPNVAALKGRARTDIHVDQNYYNYPDRVSRKDILRCRLIDIRFAYA